MAHNVRRVGIGFLVVLASVVGFGTAASADGDFGTDGTRVTGTDGTRVTGTDGTRVTSVESWDW
jgi:hypothetical protein